MTSHDVFVMQQSFWKRRFIIQIQENKYAQKLINPTLSLFDQRILHCGEGTKMLLSNS